MLVTFEMSISAKDAQFLNAYCPIEVTDSGRAICANEVQYRNM